MRVAKIIPIVLLTLIAFPASGQDRFIDSRPYLDQLVELAEANGVRESEISAALFDARVVPDFEDLQRAYAELDPRSCEEVMQTVTKLAFENKPCWYRKFYSTSEETMAIWNERFGYAPEEALFWLVKRSASTANGKKLDWDYPSITPENIEKTKDYDKFIEYREGSRFYASPHYFNLNDANEPRSDFATIYAKNRELFLRDGKRTPEQERQHAKQAVANLFEPDVQAIVAAYNRAMPSGVVQVSSLEKGKCHSLKISAEVLCEVRMNVKATGASNPLIEMATKMYGNMPRPYVYVVLRRSGQDWEYVRDYDRCTRSGTGFDCEKYQ